MNTPVANKITAYISNPEKYTKPNTFRSLWQLATTFPPYFFLWYLAYRSLDYSYFLTLAIIVLNTGFAARIFIIQHDCGHGAFLKWRLLENVIGCICSIFSLIPYYYWRKVHAIHHKDLGDLDHRSPGEFPVMTVEEFLNSTEKEKKIYRFFRNPFVLLAIVPALLFFVLYRFPRKSAVFTKKETYSSYITDLVLLTIIIVISSTIGYKEFFLVQLPLSLSFSTIAIWMFYIQHQYENTYWVRHEELNFFEAALKASSYLKLPAIFNWFTGNVGFHHVHHLSSRIPNYYLKMVHEHNENLHTVTTFNFWDSFKTFKCALWDEKQKRLISFKELAEKYSN